MENKTTKIVLTALMMALCLVATMFVRMPIPFTQGYVHLGDAMVFMAALMLGRKYGIIAGGIGPAMADILGGYAAWAPWTFAIKAAMVLVLGTAAAIADKKKDKWNKSVIRVVLVTGMVVAGILMTIGYFFAEGVMYGNYAAAALGIPWNIGQFAVGMVVSGLLYEALMKTQAKKVFTYHI